MRTVFTALYTAHHLAHFLRREVLGKPAPSKKKNNNKTEQQTKTLRQGEEDTHRL